MHRDSPPPGRKPVQVRTGMRMTIRYLLDAEEAAASGAAASDALGEVTAVEADTVVVATRRGEVRVPKDRIIAAKQVPPPPTRRPSAPAGGGTS